MVKPVGAETMEAETIEGEARVEPARRKMRKMTDTQKLVEQNAPRPAPAHAGERRRKG